MISEHNWDRTNYKYLKKILRSTISVAPNYMDAFGQNVDSYIKKIDNFHQGAFTSCPT